MQDVAHGVMYKEVRYEVAGCQRKVKWEGDF